MVADGVHFGHITFLEVEDDTSHRAEAVPVIGVDLHAQANAAVTGDAAKTNFLGSYFNAGAVHPVLAVGPAALAIHPLIAGRRIDQAAFTSTRTEAALDAIFPVDVAKALGGVAFNTNKDRAERNIDTGDAADQSAIHDGFARDGAEFGATVKGVIAAKHADIGLDAKSVGAIRRGFLRRSDGRQGSQNGCGGEKLLHMNPC